jgi:hypothetical protein
MLDGWAAVDRYLDGSVVDALSFICALIYAEVRRRKACPPRKLICKENGIVANGVGIFPLIILTMASFSSFTLQKLLEANKLILSVAGFVALMAILDD